MRKLSSFSLSHFFPKLQHPSTPNLVLFLVIQTPPETCWVPCTLYQLFTNPIQVRVSILLIILFVLEMVNHLFQTLQNCFLENRSDQKPHFFVRKCVLGVL